MDWNSITADSVIQALCIVLPSLLGRLDGGPYRSDKLPIKAPL